MPSLFNFWTELLDLRNKFHFQYLLYECQSLGKHSVSKVASLLFKGKLRQKFIQVMLLNDQFGVNYLQVNKIILCNLSSILSIGIIMLVIAYLFQYFLGFFIRNHCGLKYSYVFYEGSFLLDY